VFRQKALFITVSRLYDLYPEVVSRLRYLILIFSIIHERGCNNVSFTVNVTYGAGMEQVSEQIFFFIYSGVGIFCYKQFEVCVFESI